MLLQRLSLLRVTHDEVLTSIPEKISPIFTVRREPESQGLSGRSPNTDPENRVRTTLKILGGESNPPINGTIVASYNEVGRVSKYVSTWYLIVRVTSR